MGPKKTINFLKKQHLHYLQEKTNNAYKNLSEQQRNKLEEDFNMWLHLQHHAVSYLGMTGIYKQLFLTQVLIPLEERIFDTWALSHGYSKEDLIAL